jgi:ADP-dependent NAD(P)H-hydrate dehydratase
MNDARMNDAVRKSGSVDRLPKLSVRKPDSHKGDFGRALLIGGSRGMSGAISLSGMAAMRSGAGLVTLAVPDRCLETVAGFEPSYMTVPLPDDHVGRIAAAATTPLIDRANTATAIACGPGLGRSEELVSLVRQLYDSLPQPLVVDADGLNALAHHPDGLASPGGPRIITPHPGEFRRLWGDLKIATERLTACATELAQRHGIIVILKGHRTLVTDGERCFENTTGNPGLATGGTGDILTGIVTALLCQQLSIWDASRLAVHLHGLAGDLAAEQLGQTSLVASDLVHFLPAAFQQHAAGGEAG